jgi:siderophore synthetase component
MTDPLNSESPSKPGATASKLRSPGFLAVFSFAVILVTMLSVFATIPRKTSNANAPAAVEPTAIELAIQQDLKASKQKIADQLRELKETLASGQAERKRLSDAVAALSSKLELLQQSFARVQEAPPVQPSDPAKRNRGNR